MKRYIVPALFLIMLCSLYCPAAAQEASYPLGPGDIIEISVWKDESLSREVVIPPDCKISFPLIGDINVRGLCTTDLRNMVKKRLEEYIPDAPVNVMILQVNNLKAYVIGKVNKPGQFPVDMDTTVMQILSMAGGLNPFASPGNIIVLRTRGGNTQKIPFDYKKVEKGEALEQNIVLERGDVVVVP